jgi:putative transposase
MRNSRFTTEQIVIVLQEWFAGGKPGELARRHGITETALHRWKQKYGDIQLTEAKRLKPLEDENRQLRRLVADQALNLQVVKDLLGKKW